LDAPDIEGLARSTGVHSVNQIAITLTTAIAPNPLSGATSMCVFDDHDIRVGGTPDAPVFVAEDVCDAFSLGKHRDAITKLDADERGSLQVDTLGGRQWVAVVTESGLYSLILRCRGATKPGTVAHRFRCWVTSEVLPTIRRAGSYGAPAFDPNDPAALRQVLLGYTEALMVEKARNAQLGQALVVVGERAEIAEANVAAVAPKAEFYDAFADADGLFGLHNAAQAIKAPPQKFAAWLKLGYVFYQGGELMPKATFVMLGIFEVKVRMVDQKARSRTFLTPRGLQYLERAWQKYLLKTGQAKPATLFDAA
jgi:anti-repressor protein